MDTSRPKRMLKSSLLLATALVVGAYGCGNDSNGGGGDGGTGGSGGTGGGGTEATYAVITQIFGEGGENQSYVLLTDSLDEEIALDIGDAVLEVAGRAIGGGPEDQGVLFVASDLEPDVNRYELNEDGQLIAGPSVSFLNEGVVQFGEYGQQFQFVSSDKAYWLDGPTAQAVVWNPTDMAVTGSIDLSVLANAGEVLSFTTAPILDGDMLYAFVGWRLGPEVPSRAAVIAIDTTDDSASVVITDDCGYVREGYLADDGYIYMATEAYGTAVYTLDTMNAAPPCLIRYDTTSGVFDESYNVALDDLLDVPTGSLIVGPNNSVFLRWLDEAAASADNPRVLASEAAWGWATLTVGDTPTASEISGLPLSGGSVVPLFLGDRVFAPVFDGRALTQFLEVLETGPASETTLEVPGLVFAAAKLR